MRLFVVHAEEDAWFVQGFLLNALRLLEGEVLVSTELDLGAPIVAEIARGAASPVTVVVVSPAFLASPWAQFANDLAVQHSVDAANDGGATLVPAILADCELPLLSRFREPLDFRNKAPEQWEAEAAKLRKRMAAPAPVVTPVPCPYPGIRPFTMEDAARFHGRDKEVRELLGRLRDGQRELYVIGPSGSGKSSLVAAGLVPSLHASPELAGGAFVVRTMRPGADPTAALADALQATAAERGDAALGWLGDAVGRLLASHPEPKRLLIFVDQLEELFTTAKSQPRAAFIAALRALRSDARVALVLTMRADFYASLMESALWTDLDGQLSRLDVGPLRGDRLRRAIEAPARAVGVYFEPVLVERLLDDVADEPGALPLLQDTLLELWHKRTRGLLRLAEYEAMSDGTRTALAVTVARRADGALNDLSPGRRDIARRVLLRLVQFGDGTATTRRQQARAALATAGDAPEDIDAVVRHLADRRLITTSGGDDMDPSARVDLAHEILLSAWPTLGDWIRSRKEDEQRRRQLEFHVSEWVVQRNYGGHGLFDAIELAEAERWIAGETARELGYSSDLPRFLAASREAIEDAERQKQLARELQARERQAAQDERARLRRRLSRSVIAILSVFSIVASGLWIVASRERTNAQRQLGLNEQEQARALLVDGHDPSDAVLHLVQAVNLGVDSQVLRTLVAEVKHGLWRTAMRHGGPVWTAVFSPDGTRVVTASNDGTARVWDATTGAPLGVPLKHESIVSAVFSPDGARIVTAGEDGTARIWDAATGAPLGVPLKHQDVVWRAVFSPDGTRVVTASTDGTARVWDATTGAPLGVPLEHEKPILSAAFSPDGTRVVTASMDGTARVWDATTGAPLGIPFKHQGMVYTAAFSPDGTRLLTAGLSGTARVWDAATGASLVVLLEHKTEILGAVFSPDGTRVVTASADGTARLWDAATGAPLGRPLKHEDMVRDAAFSPDGTRVVTASADGTARVWDAFTGEPFGLPLTHEYDVRSAAFSPDGSRIVTASGDGTARVWDATTGAPFGTLMEHLPQRDGATFSPDGTRGVTISDDGTARVWDAGTGAPLGVALEHEGKIHRAAFSSDGTRIVTASENGTARVWDAATGAPLGVPLKHGTAVDSAAFSLDGNRIVTTGDRTVRVWDAATGDPVGVPLKHPQEVNSAAFSPDGTRIVTASDASRLSTRGIARVWDTATGAPLGALLKHECNIVSAVFSPDGTRVVTTTKQPGIGIYTINTCKHGTARIWDTATGASLGGPLKHEQWIRGAVFSPDGTRVIAPSDDGTQIVWNVVETGALSLWVEQAVKCVVPGPDAVGSSAVCPLSGYQTTPADLLARARSLIAVADRATFSGVWSLPRADYRRASEVLDGNRGSVTTAKEHDGEELRHLVSVRIAMLDGLEGHLQEARTRVGADAPETDALLLNQLSGIAHDELKNDDIALQLLLRAHELTPKHADILANLAEVYFAAGQYENSARTAGKLDKLPSSPHRQLPMAALAWATARLTRTPVATQAARLLRMYKEIANGARIDWSWKGTRGVLNYGRLRFEDVKPILDVLALLEQEVTDETRAELAKLLQVHTANASGTE